MSSYIVPAPRPARNERARFAGNKGFHKSTPRVLVQRLIEYRCLAADERLPGALRDYAATTAEEIHAELTRRATRTDGAGVGL